jgi:hypothetical protein
MKRAYLLLLPLMPVFLIAQTAQNAAIKNLNSRLTKVEKEVKTKKWYNPPANAAEAKDYHLFLSGEFLWWKAEEDGLAYSYRTNNPSGSPAVENEIRLEEMDFDWNFGFRVAGGFDIPHDHWDVSFAWTSLDTHSKTHKIASTGEGMFPYWAFPNSLGGLEFFDRAQGSWKFSLNMGDAELGKDFYVGKSLSVRPFIGPRTAWVDQTFEAKYSNASVLGQTLNDFIHMSCDYWGLGPRAGCNMQWWMTKRFSIYAVCALSLLYGEFRVRQKQQTEIVNVAEIAPLHFTDSYHMARPITDLAIGFGWDTLFGDDQLHFGLKVGWEQHVFFDQNQFIRFVSSTTNSLLSDRGDIALEGLTAQMRLDF